MTVCDLNNFIVFNMANVYNDVLTSCRKSFLDRFPHFLIPRQHLQNEVHVDPEEDDGYFFPYTCAQPLPFLPPVNLRFESGNDPATYLTKKKLRWRLEVNNMKRKKNKTVCKKIQDIISSEKGIGELSTRDTYFVNLVSSDPDKEFEGVYNWYFSGGCLEKLQIGGETVLLTTCGEKNNKLYSVHLNRKKVKRRLLNSTKDNTCSSDYPIHQVRSLCSQGYVCVRQYKKSYMYSIDQNLKPKRIYETESEYPYTGIDLNPHMLGRYCTVNSNRNIQEWDVNKKKVFASTRLAKECELSDKWCSVSYSSEANTVMMADRSGLYFLDIRSKGKPCQKIFPKNVPHMLEVCENVSMVLQSCMQPYSWYTCMDHHILLYDARNSLKPLQCWTHFLSSSPLYGCSVSAKNDQEVVCIANQEPGEIITIVNTWKEENPHCEAPVLSLPNIRDTLTSAKLCGLWLDPTVQCRAKLSLTGLVWLPPETSKLSLLSQTSVGDVFSHNLNQKEEDSDDSLGTVGCFNTEDLHLLSNWENKLLKRNSPTVLKVTSRKSMHHLYKYLKCNKNTLLKEPDTKECNTLKMSVKEMQSCTDLLAQKILEVWDIERENDEYKGTSFQSTPSPEPVDKVRAWVSTFPSKEMPDSPLPERENVGSKYLSRKRKRKRVLEYESEFEITNTDLFNTSTSENASYDKRNFASTPLPKRKDNITQMNDIFSQETFFSQSQNTDKNSTFSGLDFLHGKPPDRLKTSSAQCRSNRLDKKKSSRSAFTSGF